MWGRAAISCAWLLLLICADIPSKSAACTDCSWNSHPLPTFQGAESMVEEMQNEAVDDGSSSAGGYFGVSADESEEEQQGNGVSVEEINAREDYIREMVRTKVLNALRTYGYQPGQPWHQTAQTADVPIAQEITSAFAERFLDARSEATEDENESDEDDEVEDEAQAKSIIHLKPIAGHVNSFELDLQNVSVNTSANAELLIEVPEGVRRVRVLEKTRNRARMRVASKRLLHSEEGRWTRLSVRSKMLKKWVRTKVKLSIDFEYAPLATPVTCKPPYVVVSLLPVVTSRKRYRRNSSHCHLMARYISLSDLFGFSTFPEGVNFFYCAGHCSAADRYGSTADLLLHRMTSMQGNKMCCVPTDYKMFTVFVLLRNAEQAEAFRGYNHTESARERESDSFGSTRLVKIDLPNLIANHCGCV